jgi:hypothetical protein
MASDYTFGIFKHFFISVKQTYIPFPSGDALCKCFFVFVDLSDDEKLLPKIKIIYVNIMKWRLNSYIIYFMGVGL